MKTNVTTQQINRFSTQQWQDLTQKIASAFRFDAAEQTRFSNSRTARLIGALPYLAGCAQAERLALSHLSVYVLSNNEATRYSFDHQPSDDADVMTRLACINTFTDGDQSVIERGMKLLALQMICGYNRDMAKDTASGEYNPLNSQRWDGQAMADRLRREIGSTECTEMEGIMTVEIAAAAFWFQ